MKKNYTKPIIEYLEFEMKDVLVLSNAVTDLGDGDYGITGEGFGD